MKLTRTLTSTALVIVFSMVLAGPAAARNMSREVVEPGAVEGDPLERTPSLQMAQPLEDEAFERMPAQDMGIYPFDAAQTRQSLLWNVFPEQPDAVFFEKAPAVDMGFYPLGNVARLPTDAVRHPMEEEVFERRPTDAVRHPMEEEVFGRRPTDAVRHPMEEEVFERRPTDAVRHPMEEEVFEKRPTDAVRHPMEAEVFERQPSQAVREPLNVDCCGPTMRFDLKDAASAEIAIYSVSGRLVRTLTEALPSGESSLTWDGMDDRGCRAASGVYFARAQVNKEAGKGKLVLVH